MSKEEKRRAIKELLRQKLGITNIYDIVIGKQLDFEQSQPAATARGNQGGGGGLRESEIK